MVFGLICGSFAAISTLYLLINICVMITTNVNETILPPGTVSLGADQQRQDENGEGGKKKIEEC